MVFGLYHFSFIKVLSKMVYSYTYIGYTTASECCGSVSSAGGLIAGVMSNCCPDMFAGFIMRFVCFMLLFVAKVKVSCASCATEIRFWTFQRMKVLWLVVRRWIY